MSAWSVSGTASSPSVARRLVAAVARVREPAVRDEHPDRLDRVQRDALGARDDRRGPPAPAGPGTRPASSVAHRRLVERLEVEGEERRACPRPSPGRRSSSSGPGERDDQDRDVAAPVEQVLDEVERARVGPVEVLEHAARRCPCAASRSKNVRQAANSSAAPPAGASSDAEEREQRAARSSAAPRSSGTCSRRASRDLARGSSPRRRSRAGRPGARTISPSAQKRDALAVRRRAALVPPDRSRRGRRRTSGTPRRGGSCRCRPGPVIETSRARRSRAVAWNRSLSSRSSSSRPTNGASSALVAAPAAALGDDAQRAPRRDRRGLALEQPARRPPRTRSRRVAARCVASPTSTVPGGRDRLEPRGGVDEVARDHALVRAPRVTAASPVSTPARAWMPGPERPARRRRAPARRGPRARRRPRARSGRPTRP